MSEPLDRLDRMERLLRRAIAAAVKEDRRFRVQLKAQRDLMDQLTAAQLVTEELMQRFLKRSTNGGKA